MGLDFWAKNENKNLLTRVTSFSWYKHQAKKFAQFLLEESNLVFSNNVQGVMKSFDISIAA